jgi:thioredoxin-related protein
MLRVVLAVAIVVTAAVVAEAVRRRRSVDVPTQPRHEMPALLDRQDFSDPAAAWLVAVFASDSCASCADVVRKAEVLRSADVAVDVVSYQRRRDLHERYAIDAVPCLVVADAAGAVHTGFLGPVTATDLWAAVADARQPGSIDRSEGCRAHDH